MLALRVAIEFYSDSCVKKPNTHRRDCRATYRPYISQTFWWGRQDGRAVSHYVTIRVLQIPRTRGNFRYTFTKRTLTWRALLLASASQPNEGFSRGSLPLFGRSAATSLFVLRSVERSREGEKEEYSVNHYPGVCREGEGSLL